MNKLPGKDTVQAMHGLPIARYIMVQCASLAGDLVVVFVLWRYFATNVPADKKYWTFWPRFWAGCVDKAVFGPWAILAAMAVNLSHTPAAMAFILATGRLLFWIYSVGMHAKYGQTLGKMVCRVRILDEKSESPITFKQALIRDSVPIVLTVLLLPFLVGAILNDGSNNVMVQAWLQYLYLCISYGWFGLEVLTMLTNDKCRAFQDYLAGTIVVRTNLKETHVSSNPITDTGTVINVP